MLLILNFINSLLMTSKNRMVLYIRNSIYHNIFNTLFKIHPPKGRKICEKSNSATKFVGKFLKIDANDDTTDVGNDQSMFVLTISEKIKEMKLKMFSTKSNSLIKDGKVSRRDS